MTKFINYSSVSLFDYKNSRYSNENEKVILFQIKSVIVNDILKRF